jgi:hypothetical protein
MRGDVFSDLKGWGRMLSPPLQVDIAIMSFFSENGGDTNVELP